MSDLRRNATNVFLLVLYYGFLNVIFQIVSLHFGFKRNLFGIELLGAFFFFSMGWRLAGFCMLLIAVVFEALLGIASIFYLFDAAQVADMLSFLLEARPGYLGSIFAVLIILMLLTFFVLRMHKKGNIHQGIIILFIGVIFLQLQWRLSAEQETFFSPTLADRKTLLFGSNGYFFKETLATNGWQVLGGAPDEKTDYVPIRHPSAVKTVWSQPPGSHSVLLIVDEAWGQPKNGAVLEAQIRSLRENPSIKNIEVGRIYAKGATAAGELRELCGVIPTRLNFRKITPTSMQDCLPILMAKNGYSTFGIHGAFGKMYNRAVWWPVVGIDTVIFREKLPKTDHLCFSFPGYCDRDLFQLVAEKLEKKKSFIYWMTLNSHIPYDRRDIDEFRTDLCQVWGDLKDEESLCNYQNLHTQFFERLSIMANNKKLNDVEVLVVGDHPPIFDSNHALTASEQFVRDTVPFMHFRIEK